LKEFKNHSGSVGRLAFSADDRLLASCSGDEVALSDLKRARTFPILRDHSALVASIAFAADGRTLVSASCDGTAKLWNLATCQVALTLKEHDGPVTFAAFAPNGNLLATGGADGMVRLWPAPPFSEIPSDAEAAR
jgi:WD40 repeat protein